MARELYQALSSPYLAEIGNIRGPGAKVLVGKYIAAFGANIDPNDSQKDEKISLSLAQDVIRGDITLARSEEYYSIDGKTQCLLPGSTRFSPVYRNQDGVWTWFMDDTEVIDITLQAVDEIHSYFPKAPRLTDYQGRLRLALHLNQGLGINTGLGWLHRKDLIRMWLPDSTDELPSFLQTRHPELYYKYLAEYDSLVRKYGEPASIRDPKFASRIT